MSNTHMIYIDGVADFEHQLRASLNDLGIEVGTSPASEVATLNAITYKLSAEGLAARIRTDEPQQVFITPSPIA